MKTYYRLFDHTADLGMEIFGADVGALFTNAGKALFEVMLSTQDQGSEDCHRHRIEVEGQDWADLMVNWLRELLYFWNGAQQIVARIEIESLSPNYLQALVMTMDFLPLVHRINKEIKAVTYHQIVVAPHKDGGWWAKVIFDV